MTAMLYSMVWLMMLMKNFEVFRPFFVSIGSQTWVNINSIVIFHIKARLYTALTLTHHYDKFVTMEKDDLLITAAQAQLALSPEEEGRLRTAVSEMLDYFELMNEVDVTNLNPTTHALVRENALRADNPNQNNNHNNNFNNNQEALISRAPENEDNFIVIPNVL